MSAETTTVDERRQLSVARRKQLIASAAEAIERFPEDELEAYAEERRRKLDETKEAQHA